MNNKKYSGGLFWRISFTFLLVLLIVGFTYVFITYNLAEVHFQQKNQRLNASLADHIISEVKPFLNGEIKEDAADEIMHHMMAINPSIEVYILDPNGKILNYVAPYKRVKLDSVNLAPVEKFIENEGEIYVVGDDPRNPGVQKVFSAAPVEENGEKIGYVYTVLASEEYDSVSEYLRASYMLRLGSRYMVITLIAALVVGILIIWLITKNLRKIIDTVRRFQGGDMKARIPLKAGNELNGLGIAFNEMADTIVGNIENLKSMENLRRELVGNVSHDLRTPLAVIHGYIETLMMKKDSISQEEQEKYLKTIMESTERLKTLVNELFELSKLEAKQITPNKEPFFINELIQDIAQKYQIIARKKEIVVKADIKEDIPLVHADVGLIERVMQNLIDNAIKYTPKGGMIIIETDDRDQNVEIKVSDTGPGIPAEQIPFIFDRYHIGDKRISLDKNSTGLGLAIVKKILEIHDATINLKSKLNQGTSFSFQLPSYRNVGGAF
ncbi:MAG: HAMP domain-containing sensor histidine kinase [Bacteroidota bacterium]